MRRPIVRGRFDDAEAFPTKATLEIADCRGGGALSSNICDSEVGVREFVLGQLRCAALKAKLAQLEIETIAIALKGNIITPEQAVAMFWDSDPVAFLGLEIPS